MITRRVLICCPPRVLYRLDHPSRNLTDTYSGLAVARLSTRHGFFRTNRLSSWLAGSALVRPFLRCVLTFRSFFLSLAKRLVRCFRLPQIRRHIYFGGLAAVLVEIDLHLVGVVAFDNLVLYVIGLVTVD